jgi:hypothetical protein
LHREHSISSHGYPNAQPAPEADLPHTGPYLTKFAVQSMIDSLTGALAALDLAEAENELPGVKAALLLARETIQQKLDALQEV